MKIGKMLLLGATFFLATNIAYACSCELPQPGKSLRQRVVAARNRSAAVFVGEVVEVTAPPGTLYVDVKFKVERSWKPGSKSEMIVRTGSGHGDCGYHFEVGGTYLVYASGVGEDKLETNICQRTQSLADAKEDLRLLGKSKPLLSACGGDTLHCLKTLGLWSRR